MAYAEILQTYAEGGSTRMRVGIRADGPDALDECVRRVSVLWHVTVGDDADEDAGNENPR